MLSDQSETHGRLIVIVGPSGSGKDTLINWLKDRLAKDKNYMFVRRTVTRDADGATEDHDTLTPAQFDDMEARGKFAVTWEAHSLRYGIPIGVLAHIKAGGLAIANGSRRALPELASAFGDIVVINLRVDRAILAERLAGRGREDAAQIERRLSRMDTPISGGLNVIQIENSSKIERAGEAVLTVLAELAQTHATA